jgi:hypothetical protein
MKSSPWTDEAVDKFKQLVKAGFWASKIAEEMGISRKSVFCKAERLYLQLSVPPRPNSPWTDEAVAKLRRGVERRVSASLIAEEIGGISRMSVIGKARRLGLKLAGTSMGEPRLKRNRKQCLTKTRLNGTGPPSGDLTPTAPFPRERLDQCALIAGEDRGNVMCCGRPVEPGTSWCTAHMRMVYVHYR